MNNKTIVILSQVNFDDSPYTSYTHSHAIELVNLGYKVIVLAAVTLKNKAFASKYKGQKIIDGVNIIYFKRIGFSNILYNSKINLNAISYYLACKKIFKDICKNNNVALIDAHTFKVQGVVASILKTKYNIPTFVTLHGTSFERNLHSKNGIKSIINVANKVDYMIGVSEKIKKNLNKLDVKNAKVIYNGISQYNIKKKNRKEFGIVSVGYFTKVKNFDIVIKVFANVLKKYSKSSLTLIGDGPSKEECIALVKHLNIDKNVTFTGFIENKKVNELLSENNVFVLPSSPEGFGISYVEAMKNGCITIGTKGEGIDGFIKDNINGFLVDIDVEQIAKKIINIFENKFDNIDNIRKKGMDDSKNLTWENNAKKYIELLGDINGNKE